MGKEERKEISFSYADAIRPVTPHDFVDDEKAPLLKSDIGFLGTYAHAVEIPNGIDPPAYEAVHPQTIVLPRPPSPPSTTLISVYSEPIRVEYEESERLHQQAGCGKLLWNYYACCGYAKESIWERMFNGTDSRMLWTILGCFCCLLPIFILLLIYYSYYTL